SSRTITVTACRQTIDSKSAAGSATCSATTIGSLVAAYHADRTAATAPAQSIDASQSSGRAVRRARRVPAADPIASPLTNAAAIVANAYVVGPSTSASSPVQA